MRKIDTSDNIYIMESTTGNLFSLTQEGAPLCRIIAKVNFMVGDWRASLGKVGGRSSCLLGGNCWLRFVIATALTCCVTLEESLFLMLPRLHDFISYLTQKDIVVRVPERNITYEKHRFKAVLLRVAYTVQSAYTMAVFTLDRLRTYSCSGLGDSWRATGFLPCRRVKNAGFQC